MILRVLHTGRCDDIDLNDKAYFSIGNKTRDGFDIPNQGLVDEHIELRKESDTWIIKCNGQVFLSDGQVISDIQLEVGQLYIIDPAHKISFYALEDFPDSPHVLDLSHVKQIRIGRLDDNDVCMPNSMVSADHARIVRDANRYFIIDGNGRNRSTNGTYVNHKLITRHMLEDGDEIEIGDSSILFKDGRIELYGNISIPNGQLIKPDDNHSDSLKMAEGFHSEFFKRSPRIQEQLPSGKLEIPAPPAKSNKPEINWLSTLLPAVVTVAIAVTMALVFKNTMMMIYSLPMTIAGVVVSIANYFRGKKTYRRSLTDRHDAYLTRLEKIEDEIKEKRDAQKNAMLLADPSPEACISAVRSRSTTLWCREPDNTDFVSARLGTGSVPFSMELIRPRLQMDDKDELIKKAGELYRDNCVIEDMPVLCNIRRSGVVGLLGTADQTRTQLQNMLLHLATHHCSTELKLVCFFNEKDREELSWLADLPHTHGEDEAESYLAYTQKEADALFRLFLEVFKERKQIAQENSSYGSEPTFIPYVLFVFFDPSLLKKADPINQYLLMERGFGCGCLMAARKMAQLPKQCSQIVTLTEQGGELYNTARASERQKFCPDEVSSTMRNIFGRSMHPLYCDEGIAVATLPKGYTFYQMLGINSIVDFNIGESWGSSDLLSSQVAPSAPIGILENGEKLFFNSPPTGDNGGAHALVAGAAGSGKSEALLTLILSLALRYSPEEVGFLVIDFKGDSIAGTLTGLPHLRGVITSLDGDELQRSIVSIGAENKRRQSLFKEYNDSHPEEKKKISNIRDYTEKYRQGKVEIPLPHLFIVVDEFAEMKKQLPDVMDQFLSTAQIGRSLGVKLILATQSPSGVVDSKIRANILKQMCLKVANIGESRDMIGTDLAARIKDPGRGYLKIDDSLKIFQSAYGGGKLRLPDGSESTQLREAVDAIIAYCRRHSIQKLPDIFCPPLPKNVVFPHLNPDEITTRSFGLLPIGIRDDPASQFLGEYSMDVFSRNTLIVGSQMMGKTNLLQAILCCVSSIYGPEDVNIYILDFSSTFLKNYELLPQVGGVVTLQETEKINNLFRLLKEQTELRRQKFLKLGVSTFAAYRESGARDLPQILLLVDNLAVAKDYFPLDNDPLLSLCKEGLTVGISVAATAAQPVGGMSYLPTFANRIAFYNNDVSVYSTLFGRVTIHPKELPGRCLVSWENAVYECQSFLAFDSEREIDRAEAIRKFCHDRIEEANGKTALPIPFIPKELSASDVFNSYPEEYSDGRLLFGLDYATVKPFSTKLAALGLLAISGREKDVHNFQRYLLTSAENTSGLNAEFYIVDGIDRALFPLSRLSCVAEYSFLPSQATQMLCQVREKAEQRYTRIAQGEISILDTSPILVLMLNSSEAIDTVSSDKKALDAWKAITGKLKSMNICVILGALDNMSIPFGSEILKKVKEDRKLVFFDDIGNLKIGELPYATVKKFSGSLQSGDGYVILGNEATRVRIPDCPMVVEK